MTIVEFFKVYPIKTHYLANKAGIAVGSMRHYACGTKRPSIKAIAKINAGIQIIAKELKEAQLCGQT